jgi:general secretion pathway protein A
MDNLWCRRGLGIILVLGVFAVSGSLAFAADEAEETGRLLMILLDTGRLTVGDNQALINDKSKGAKGFTPEVFEKQLVEKFKGRTGVDLANLQAASVPALAKKLLPQLIMACKKSVAEAQSVINLEGVGFKGFIPAVFGTTTASKFRSYSDVYLRQTMNPARNPRNTPDEFEVQMLAKLADPSHPRTDDQVVSEMVENGKTLRIMMPLYYNKSCLACHGEPKGERDISGYPKEGAKEGDLGGAISVKIDLK